MDRRTDEANENCLGSQKSSLTFSILPARVDVSLRTESNRFATRDTGTLEQGTQITNKSTNPKEETQALKAHPFPLSSFQVTTSTMPSDSTTKLTAGISHVGLSVSSLEKSFEFFEALGYSKIGGDHDYPSYFLSDGSSMVTLWQTDANPTPFDRRKNVGLHHLAIKVTSMEALQKSYDIVMAIDGVKSDFAPTDLTGTPLKHAIVFEPSGNRIEFTYHSA